MTTGDDSPGFAEFVSLIEALPPEQRISFNECTADFEAGMPTREAMIQSS
jgi:hypothetical protein